MEAQNHHASRICPEFMARCEGSLGMIPPQPQAAALTTAEAGLIESKYNHPESNAR